MLSGINTETPNMFAPTHAVLGNSTCSLLIVYGKKKSKLPFLCSHLDADVMVTLWNKVHKHVN